MPTQKVEFQFITGLKRAIFRNCRLRGSWNSNGRYSVDWTESPMQEVVGEDGCPIFTASMSLDLADQDKRFSWGVVVDGPQGNNLWGIPTEVQDINSVERYRQFRLTGGGTPQVERYYFSYGRRLGANKYFTAGNITACLRFAVWAPNARSVDVVFGKRANGYIANDGTGIDPTQPVVALSRGSDGIWQGGPLATLTGSKVAPTCIASSMPKGKRSIAPIFFPAAKSAQAPSIP